MNYKKYNELAGKPMQAPVVPPPQQLNFNQMQQMQRPHHMPHPHVKSIAEKKKHIWTHEICIFKIGADWCGPCKKIAPLVEDFARKVNQHGKVMIISENADHKLSANVTSIPCFDFYFRGKKQHRQVGADLDEFMRNVKMMVSTAAGQPQQQAQKAQAYPHPAEGMQPRKRANAPSGMQGGSYPNNVRRM